ncbi:hypothetical protein HGRIS_011015 [Hohenbuehelia grisea]|uniref:DyP dimeric alpha+beta barrel domain-containing protein n=1 Tax=Hohenbuehelia grisea TaxID=104357 RepID=A0ABR3IYN7_9AGAR
MSNDTLDLDNIQGDILGGGLPKKTETFYFFEVTKVDRFRSQFSEFVPLVKTAAQVNGHREEIYAHKQQKKPGLVTFAAVNVAFSQSGLSKLGIQGDLKDKAFTAGQLKDAQSLGDPGSTTDGKYTPDWEAGFKKEIHGVFVIAGDCHGSVTKELHQIKHIFGVGTAHQSIHEVTHVRGDDRLGEGHKKEHFGWLDGISNPAIDGFDEAPFPGQDSIKPGFVLAKRDGDIRGQDRPDWAIDGSFLTFRYLFQRVPEFHSFLEENPIILPGLSRKEGSELLGARLVGRWKSGAPIDVTPLHDDKELGADPQRNNLFEFKGSIEANDQSRCPFAAHIRKTYPRADLEGPPKNFNIDKNRIVRRYSVSFALSVRVLY